MTRDPDGFPAFAEMSGGDPEPLGPDPASPRQSRLPCLGALGVALVSAGVVVWVVGTLVRWAAGL